MMRVIFLKVLFLIPLSQLLFADFTISYLINNKIKQTVFYKDKNHILFTIEDSQGIIEKLHILNSKKYLTFTENEIEHIYEISDELSENNQTLTTPKKYDFTVLRQDNNITFNGISAARWIIKDDNGIKKSIIVTNNKELYKNLQKTIEALKQILPKNKEAEASIFDMGNGYTLLKNEDLELLSFKEEPLKISLFQINKTLTPSEKKTLSKNIEKCFTTVCCGQNSANSQEIDTFLNQKSAKWKLKSKAKCTDSSQSNLESAIFTNNKKFITVEIVSKNSLLGKIDSLKEEGLNIEDLNESTLNGLKTKEAYIPSANATILDITLPNATISIYSKGKVDLKTDAKELLHLNQHINYSLSN